MTSERTINRAVSSAAAQAFDRAIRTVLTEAKFAGISTGKGVTRLIFTDAASEEDKDQAEQIALAHNLTTRTPEQIEAAATKIDAENLVSLIDTALADIAGKRAAFNGNANLTTAGALLNELAQDMTGVLKALKYVINHGGIK